MKYEIVNLEEMKVAGLSKRTQNHDKVQSVIEGVWQQFFAEGHHMKPIGQVDRRTIGLYTEYDGDFTQPYTFVAGVQSSHDEPADGLVMHTIPSGKYAKFTVKGEMAKVVGEAWMAIWNMDLPRAYTSDFEHYHNDSEDMSNQTIDIYIALK